MGVNQFPATKYSPSSAPSCSLQVFYLLCKVCTEHIPTVGQRTFLCMTEVHKFPFTARRVLVHQYPKPDMLLMFSSVVSVWFFTTYISVYSIPYTYHNVISAFLTFQSKNKCFVGLWSGRSWRVKCWALDCVSSFRSFEPHFVQYPVTDQDQPNQTIYSRAFVGNVV